MKNRKYQLLLLVLLAFFLLQCENQGPQLSSIEKENLISEFKKTNGYPSIEKYGEHLVTLAGCNDCHTPKKMGPHGPIIDSFNMLSGYPSKSPALAVNAKEMQAKGLVVTSDLTCWVGPWGTSYTANLTPDDTGIKSWDLNQFKTAIRKGKFHGQENGRDLLPPMPWEMYRMMTDEELAAVFAYLKSLKPVTNLVPAPLPPAN